MELIKMATILTVADLSDKLSTDPRTARKFLRSITPRDEQPGKGARWGIEARRVASLRKQFTKWSTEQEAKRNAREAKKAEAIDAPIDEAIDLEPTDAELAQIDDAE
jgi:hypothetical protein